MGLFFVVGFDFELECWFGWNGFCCNCRSELKLILNSIFKVVVFILKEKIVIKGVNKCVSILIFMVFVVLFVMFWVFYKLFMWFSKWFGVCFWISVNCSNEVIELK